MAIFSAKRRIMEPFKYDEELKSILKWDLVITRQVYVFSDMIRRGEGSEEFSLAKLKKNCGEIRRKIDKVTNHLHALGQPDTSDDLSLFSHLIIQKSLYKFSDTLLGKLDELQPQFKRLPPNVRFYLILSSQWRRLTNLKNLRNKYNRETELVCKELEQIIKKIKALNSEQKRVKGYYRERIQKLIIELSKRENKTLNIEKKSRYYVEGPKREGDIRAVISQRTGLEEEVFYRDSINLKGKIHVHILFSILDDSRHAISTRLENSKGRLDDIFGEQTAAEIRTKMRVMSERTPSWLYDEYRTNPESSLIFQSILPSVETVKKYPVKKLDEYLELVKNRIL